MRKVGRNNFSQRTVKIGSRGTSADSLTSDPWGHGARFESSLRYATLGFSLQTDEIHGDTSNSRTLEFW